MGLSIVRYALLVVAGAPFVYYTLALVSSWRYFRSPENAVDLDSGLHPARQHHQASARARS